MLRELAISLYLCMFRLTFLFFKLWPHQQKALFVTYFGYNARYTIEALENVSDEPIIITVNKHTHVSFEPKNNRTILDLRGFFPIRWLRFVYHLATANKVVVDNYYGFLAVTNFRKGTTCVQMWHAAGAIKKFGLEDASAKGRSKRAQERFIRVYNRFDRVIVGSEEMADIFKQSFGTPEERIWRTGIPRTDFFYREEEMKEVREQLLHVFPLLGKKKVLLYAPTFREQQSTMGTLPFDIDTLYDTFGEEYVLVVKSHPVVQSDSENPYPDFLVDMSSYRNVNHLLLVTDILITDYSSIPFEFALLEKPMIFYAYDLDAYEKERGIFGDYRAVVPGPIATNTEELVHHIQADTFDEERIRLFRERWNAYSDGSSSDNLVQALLAKQEENI